MNISRAFLEGYRLLCERCEKDAWVPPYFRECYDLFEALREHSDWGHSQYEDDDPYFSWRNGDDESDNRAYSLHEVLITAAWFITMETDGQCCTEEDFIALEVALRMEESHA